jgi:uncharacterized protein YceH (UPF0502 family)
VITLLLLRGPQTPGELRSRSDRLHDFADLPAVEAALRSLAEREEPLVEEQERRPGQKERRWAHRLGPRSATATDLSEVAALPPPEVPDGWVLMRVRGEHARDVLELFPGAAEIVED